MSKLPLTLACGDYEIVRALKEGAVPAGRHRSECADGNGFHDAPLALPAQRRIRRRRGVLLLLFCRARSGHGGRRHPGLPASPLSSRLHLRQHAQRASASRRTSPAARSASSSFNRPRWCGCAAFSSTNTACRSNRSNGSASSTRPSISTAPRNLKIVRLPHDSSVEQMLVDGETRCAAASRSDPPAPGQGSAGGAAVSELSARRSSPITRRPGSSRSCMCSASGARSSRRIPGSRSICFTPSTKRRKIAMKRLDQSARRAAGLVSRGLGRARKHLRRRSVGIRPVEAEREYAFDPCRLRARAGPDPAPASARRIVPQRLSRTQARGRVSGLSSLAACAATAGVGPYVTAKPLSPRGAPPTAAIRSR